MAQTPRIYTYEAMFLFGQAAAADLAAAIEHLREVIQVRGHGGIIAMRKWDEHRLAYEINSKARPLRPRLLQSPQPAARPHQAQLQPLRENPPIHDPPRRPSHHRRAINATDGRRELETEIKLRAERPATPEPVAAAATTGAEDSEA